MSPQKLQVLMDGNPVGTTEGLKLAAVGGVARPRVEVAWHLRKHVGRGALTKIP